MAVTLTNEQFRELLARLNVTSQNSVAQSCFKLKFLKMSNAICIYKDCTQVSDDNVLKGLKMLFYDFAAQWYQDLKTTINS